MAQTEVVPQTTPQPTGKPGDPQWEQMAAADKEIVNHIFANFGKAIQAYLRALEADPFKAEALGNLAAAYSDMGQREKAVETLKVALKLEPGNLRWRAIQSSAGSGPGTSVSPEVRRRSPAR